MARKLTRRQMLKRSAAALGALGAGAALPAHVAEAAESLNNPLAARTPHYQPRAKRAIVIFLTGGVSHVDSFDPKEKLTKFDGKAQDKDGKKVFFGSPWTARPRGESGLVVTDLFPYLASTMDDMCLIRSMHGDHGDHFAATLQMHTGSNGSALPSLGAWISYGLGTENTNLPSHVVFAAKEPYAGAQVWDSNFLPACHQGTRVLPGDEPIPNLKPYIQDESLQQRELEMLRRVNRRHLADRSEDSALRARMLSFQTAHSMQKLAPELFDLRREADHTFDLYGFKRGDNKHFGWQCMMARRMAERGVRVIELVDTGASNNWDAHGNLPSRYEPLAKKIDQPIAGLILDLKMRGMLEDTLIVCCTEFGRTPMRDKKNTTGRGHHRHAFTCWLAGGGTKGGYAHGATDDVGMHVAEGHVHVHDFHATILHLMGFDHKRLTYHHAGRDFRLTDVAGRVIHEVVA